MPQTALFPGNEDRVGYWLSPPEMDKYRSGSFDPCPFPRPAGWDGLHEPWHFPWYCNPPFNHLSLWARKAISEGGPGVFVAFVSSGLANLIRSGATIRSIGRPAWLNPTNHRI